MILLSSSLVHSVSVGPCTEKIVSMNEVLMKVLSLESSFWHQLSGLWHLSRAASPFARVTSKQAVFSQYFLHFPTGLLSMAAIVTVQVEGKGHRTAMPGIGYLHGGSPTRKVASRMP